MRFPLAGPVLVVSLVLSACGLGSSDGEVRLAVFAAASLRDAMGSVAERYEATHPGVTIALATDSSTALRTQIEQGAEPDLFLAADDRQPRILADAGLTVGRVLAFASNELVVVVPADNPAGIRTPADLAGPDVRVIAAGDEVPITAYADEAVEALGEIAGDAAAFRAAYEANVVSREDNVRAVLAKVALGEGDAGLVYATDARASSDVRSIPLPPEARVKATYAGVVPAAAPHAAEGRAFLQWIVGPAGQEILAGHGFGAP